MVSLPQGYISRMKHLLGGQAEDFLRSYQESAMQGLRVNTLKTDPKVFSTQAPFQLEEIPWTVDGFYYSLNDQPGKHPFHAAGLYYIQEPSAMMPAALLGAQPGDRVLDLCAAPGGKSAQLAASLKNRGLLVANEIHPARVKVLGENMERMGVRNAVILQETPDRLANRFEGFFDKVLVDAPCSGEGMFRKNPEACDQWGAESPAGCSDRQQAILNAAARMVRPGGTLVYSTCTFAPEENEGTLSSFLRQHKDYQVIEGPVYSGFSHGRPEWVEGAAPEVSRGIRLWPHLLRGEGHFMAILIRDGSVVSERNRGGRNLLPDVLPFAPEITELVHTVEVPEESGVYESNGHLYAVPSVIREFKGLKVLRPGLYLGECRKNRFQPSHALALALHPAEAVQALHLSSDGDEVRRYLSGDVIPCNGLKGWMTVLVDGYSLGWGKGVDGLLKNHYPKGLRW